VLSRHRLIQILLILGVITLLLATAVVKLRPPHRKEALNCAAFGQLTMLNIDASKVVSGNDIWHSWGWKRARSFIDSRPKKWKLTVDWKGDSALIESRDQEIRIKSKYPIVEDELGADFPFLFSEIDGVAIIADKSGKGVRLHFVCDTSGVTTVYDDNDGLLVNAFEELENETLVLSKVAGFTASRGPKGEYTELEMIIVDLRRRRLLRYRTPGATRVAGVFVRKGGGAIAFGREGEESCRTLEFDTSK
jgi:hypothetical protein